MNLDNIKTWTDALRTTELGQTTATLGSIGEDDKQKVCCLGLGCLVAPTIETEWVGGGGESGNFLYVDGQNNLPPIEFHDWLGLDIADLASDDGNDVLLDWPMPEIGALISLCPENTDRWRDRTGRAFRLYSCAGLNDEVGLTFSQIADVIDYFGLRDQPA